MFERFTVVVGCALSCWEIVYIKFKYLVRERETKEKEEMILEEKFCVGFAVWACICYDQVLLCVLRFACVLTYSYVVKNLNRVPGSHQP